MKTGKAKAKVKHTTRTDLPQPRVQPVQQQYYQQLPQWIQTDIPMDQINSFLDEENMALPIVSKIRDGLFVGTFEASSSQDV